MEFNEQLVQFSQRVNTLKGSISTEESTKTSIVMPFFLMLGYDVFNPMEFSPELTADVGIKKGEKVDYAIIFDSKPLILIECKACDRNLDKHCSQLYRYFSVTDSKFAILTNGLKYNFYTDLDEPNKMDLTPFLEIDLLNITSENMEELRKFHKINFNVDNIFNSASELKYHRVIKEAIKELYTNPSDDFIRLVLSDIYHGIKTQNIVNRFKSIVQKSFSDFISDLLSANIVAPLDKNANLTVSGNDIVPANTTKPEDIEAFYIIRSIIGQRISRDLISYKCTESYLSIIYNNSPRKWICRFILGSEKKQIILPEGKNFKRIYIKNIQEIYNHSEALLSSVTRFLDFPISLPSEEISSQAVQKVFKPEISTGNSADVLALVQGQKTKLSTISDRTELSIQLDIPAITGADVDIACFGVDINNKLADDQYFVFYNQLESEDGSIIMLTSESSVSNIFNINLSLLPKSIDKLVFTASIDGDMCMNILPCSSIIFSSSASKLAEYKFTGEQFRNEKAIILAELYRKNNDWIISIVSQGFNGGLDILLSHFGGQAL